MHIILINIIRGIVDIVAIIVSSSNCGRGYLETTISTITSSACDVSCGCHEHQSTNRWQQ